MSELIAALTAFLKEATVYLGRQNGKAAATLAPSYPAPSPEIVEKAVAKRAKKEKVAPAEVAAASPFATTAGPVEAANVLNAEDALEAARRGQEVMGLFIRRFLKAAPTGLERAKKIINDTLGLPRTPAVAWKLEDFTPTDWLKLTPKFEAELDKADAK